MQTQREPTDSSQRWLAAVLVIDLIRHPTAAKEETRYEKLRLDVAQLSAPERIVATAQQRLGMVVPPQVASLMAPAPADVATPDDPAAPSLAGGWAEVKPHLGTRP